MRLRDCTEMCLTTFDSSDIKNIDDYSYLMDNKKVCRYESDIRITNNNKLIIEDKVLIDSYELDDIQYNLLNKSIKEGSISEFQKEFKQILIEHL